jgi:hypothetical protein
MTGQVPAATSALYRSMQLINYSIRFPDISVTTDTQSRNKCPDLVRPPELEERIVYERNLTDFWL